MKKSKIYWVILILGFYFYGCQEKAKIKSQKPVSTEQVFPSKVYYKAKFNNNPPFTFELPNYASFSVENEKMGSSFWYNVDFGSYKAKLHITYYPVNSSDQILDLTEDARKLAMKHSIRASSITPEKIDFPEKNVYGIYYIIDGDAASSTQFFLTDSTSHYFRGALYFNETSDYDSLKPIIRYLDKDIRHIVNTFEWKSKP